MINNLIIVNEVWEMCFIRNSSFPQDSHNPSHLRDRDLSFFYAFDYYDKVICRHADNNLSDCLGLKGKLRLAENSSPIASNFMTLVSLSSDKKSGEDPFTTDNREFDSYPYLSLIIVSILSVPRRDVFAPTETNIAVFLEHCVSTISNKVQTACEEYYDKRGTGSKACFRFRVLHSLNTGSFCIVLRSNDIDLGYHIAMCIKALEIPSKGTFPALHCGTFTITCIAQRLQDNVAVAPKVENDKNSVSDVALRLAVEQNLIRRISSLPNAVDNGRGLYGRYDITITLSLQQFLELYPWIYAHKFGTSQPDSKEKGNISNQTVKELIEIFNAGSAVQCINERVLVNTAVLNNIESHSLKNRFLDDRTRQIEKEKSVIESKILALRNKGRTLPFYNIEFLRCVDMFEDVWRNFENLRNQEDSMINGNILFAQVWLLLDIVETYLDSMDERSKKETNYASLVIQSRKAANSISRFHKMMQSVNQQSMQSPNYEIQLHCDLEKLVIAYSEFSRRFLIEHFYPYTNEDVKTNHQLVLPICSVDPNIDSIQADPLFLLPYLITSSDKLCKSNPRQERLLLAIKMPDIDVMGDLYHTLPMICHEISHNFRVISREERNNELCKYMIEKLAVYIVRQWFSRTSDKIIYTEFGVVEQRIQKIIADEIFDQYLSYIKADPEGDNIHEKSNIGVLISNLLFFLDASLFINQDQHTASTSVITRKMLRSVIEELASIYQQYQEMCLATWYSDYLTCMNLLKEEKEVTRIDRDRIISLSKKITIDIFNNGLAVWITRENIEFISFILENYEMTTEENDTFIYFRNEMKKYSILPSIPVAPVKVDRFIINLEKITEQGGLIDSLCFSKPKDKKKSADIRRSFELRKKQLINSWHEHCRTIKNISQLNLISAAEVSSQQSNRDILYMEFMDRLRTWIRTMEKDKPGEWTIFGSEKVQDYLLPLGIDQDNRELFKLSLGTILNSVPIESVVTIIKDSAQLYREIFADLGMCVSLGLDVFGYLNVFGTNKVLRGDGQSEIDDFGKERILTVCWVISRSRLHDIGTRSQEYFCKMTEEIEKSLKEEGIASDEYQEFKNETRKLLLNKDYMKIGKKMSDLNIGDIISKWSNIDIDEGKNYERLLGLFKSLWYTSLYICIYLSYPEDSTNEGLINHFRKIYEMVLSKDPFTGKNDSHVLKSIGKVYNSGELELAAGQEERFKDTISFVLFNYYQSWGVFSQGCYDSDEIDEWINPIIAGSEKRDGV